jgi:hypothetical protein
LIEDLDRYRDLELALSDADRAVSSSVRDRQVRLIAGDRAPNNRVRPRLSCLAKAQPLLDSLAYRPGNLLRQGGFGSLIVEGKNRDRFDRGRQASTGKAVTSEAGEQAKASEEPRYRPQRCPV